MESKLRSLELDQTDKAALSALPKPEYTTFMASAHGLTSEALKDHLEVLIKQRRILSETNTVGDEGGFAPNFQDNKEALDLLVEAIQKAGFEGKMKIGNLLTIVYVFYMKCIY